MIMPLTIFDRMRGLAAERFLMNEIVRVSMDDLRPDMILARDVVTYTGVVLLARNTMLNNINYARLVNNDVDHLFIYANSINPNNGHFSVNDRTTSLEQQRIPIEERPEFTEFSQEYQDKSEEVKNTILAISNGAEIDLDQLYTVTDGIMNKLRCKSDVFAFLGYIKNSDEYTFNHSINVSLLCNLFARWLALSEEDLIGITTSGILHDVGKTKIPGEILNKTGRLTDAEFEEMKNHSLYGYRILQNQMVPEEIKLCALMHHEKIDGSGYPLGAKITHISTYARILTICDIYDAMTANRVYRSKICPFEVIKTFETKVYGELDTRFLWVFLQSIAYTYLGSWIKLSDGQEAEVIFINKNDLSRPMVRTIDDQFIDLINRRDLNIDSLV